MTQLQDAHAPEKTIASRTGVSATVLWNDLDPFLPRNVIIHIEEIHDRDVPYSVVWAIELEMIYIQVGEENWRELERLVDAYHVEYFASFKRSGFFTGPNLVSNIARTIRINFIDPVILERRKQRSGYFLMKQRDVFIKSWNDSHPELQPPLSPTDNLMDRLHLPPWQRCARPSTGAGLTFGTGDLSKAEIAHFKRKGIRLMSIHTPPGQRMYPRSREGRQPTVIPFCLDYNFRNIPDFTKLRVD